MKNRKKAILFFCLVSVLAAFFYWKNRAQVQTDSDNSIKEVIQNAEKPVPVAVAEATAVKAEPETIVSKDEEIKSVFQEVPFTSQAPLGNWSDPIYQNGCEEASVIMAITWAKGDKIISAVSVRDEIKSISDFEIKTLGSNRDTDVDDTAKFMREYFQYAKIEVVKKISADDIIQALRQQKLVLVPAYGIALENPHYTSPGPIEHMLLISGYDSASGEFITNDSGTKFGSGYKYTKERLFGAIWAYPTSSTPAIYPGKNLAQKSMITVAKN